MNNREMIEAMEACRPGSDDLRNSEFDDLQTAVQRDAALRRRYEQTQAWDRVMGQALEDVPVPAGMCDRLLNALEGAQPMAGLSPVRPPSGVSGGARAPVRRRRWGIAVAGLAVAAALLIAWFIQQPTRPTPQPTPEFASEVIQWSDAVADTQWRTDFGAEELRGYPLDDAIRGVPRQWARLSTRYHPRTIVYDVTPPRGQRAYVFCFPAARSRTSLPPTPPLTPFSTTGGVAVGTWQRNHHVYVLAAHGGEHRYRALIQSTIVLGRRPDAEPPRPAASPRRLSAAYPRV